MKIAVITFYFSRNNYGQILQCYALQKFLQQEGHDPFVVKFAARPKQNLLEKIRNFFQLQPGLTSGVRMISDFCRFWGAERKRNKDLAAHRAFEKRDRKFSDFLKLNITFSQDAPFDFESLKKDFPAADAYIVGSDTVWGWYPEIPGTSINFLDFVPNPILRIAYAPSCGKQIRSAHYVRQIRDSLARFTAVSVRERSGVEICRAAGRNDVQLVIDPTGLLESGAYLQIAADVPPSPSRFLFMYVLNFDTPQQIEYQTIKAFCQSNNLQLKINVSDGLSLSHDHHLKEDFCFDTIPEWLAHFRDAEFVVTNSFHGVMFALLLKKQFLVLPLQDRFHSYNERQYSLLQLLELQDRIYAPDRGTFERQLLSPIDWSRVESQLGKFVKSSQKFLRDALSQKETLL